MANNTENVELDLLVKASEYVMKQDPVLKEYSRHSPGHFMRIIERMLEFHQQEANRQKIELLDMLEKSMPTPKSLSNYTLNMGAAHNPPPDTTRTNLQRIGYNSACTKSLEAFEAVRKQLEGGE